MVAKHGVERLAFQSREDVRALPGSAASESRSGNADAVLPVQRGGNEIPGETHGVRLDAVDALDHVAKKERLREFVHVNVAELHDAHAVECVREAGQKEVAARYLNPVTFDLA